MKKKLPVIVLFTFLIFPLLEAQENKPLIKLNPLFIEGIGLEESRLIESLILSYLADIGDLINYFDAARPEAPLANTGNALESWPWPRPPDYTVTGTIHLERDSRIFLLELLNTKTGETYSFTSIYKTTGELALRARSILESAFAAGGFENGKKTETPPEPISESQIVGSWRGETGIEMIRLQRGGRGVAVFSSGAQMVLSYVIEDNTLRVWQISPNSERFYYPLPYEAARELSAGAEPMSWELSLFSGGTILGGIKIATGVQLEGNRALNLLPGGDIREVEWTKVSH
ncbi:MAG: hypothetical protein LBL28_06755 [Treponema sp.]|jgi:hypothetical protein|nr:hypothetical protein [Treponema sp.]